MPSVCFYFQVHQPFRLRKFSFFDGNPGFSYFDEDKNRGIMRKVAEKCYLPTNRLLLELIHRYQGAFKVSFSVSGVALDQMEQYAPDVLASFQELAATGCVEFLAETYYHSLAGVYSVEEFHHQVELQRKKVIKLFGQNPRVFRNTELIYNDDIAARVAPLGFDGIIAEGCDDVLQWRSPNFVYQSGGAPLALLLKNYRLSDDVAFRFGNRGWESYPLTADKFAYWVHSVGGNGETVNLFMDYETFGEHQWADTGIFEFMRHLPEKILAHPDWEFATPSEVIDKYSKVATLGVSRLTSWADIDRDLTAWNGNQIQESAIRQIYELAHAVTWSGDEELLSVWRKLQTSDHFYYMCTKWCADGDVHAYFSPYENPYEAFINFMNVLRHFRERVINASGKSRTVAARAHAA